MFRNRTVSLALAGLFVWVTACTSYKQIDVREVSHHGKVRVRLTNGERETLRDPWIDGDSIKAYTSESVGGLGPQQRPTDIVAIPLEQVVELGAVSTNEVGTVFAVLGIVALATAVFFGVACSSENSGCVMQ